MPVEDQGKRSPSGESDPLLEDVRRQIGTAIGEMFTRALKDGAVIDRKDQLKPPLPVEGLVQDCEFGLILLLSRDFLKRTPALPLSLADDSKVRDMVTSLVTKAANMLLNARQDDAGGEYGEVVFFTGAPYTRRQRVDGYSANLDSAMLVLGFFAPALREYHEALANIPTTLRPAKWIRNVRDLALYICKIGIEYAEQCQVRLAAGFAGFSCDPKSVLNDDEDGPFLENSFDRLFFTWTAAETIAELLEWKKHLDVIANDVPPDEVNALKEGIDKLRGSVDEAALWCKSEFLESFQKLEPVRVAQVVKDIEPLGEAKLKKDQNERVEVVREYVQHTFHLSQYAAIRSLSPAQVTLQEVAEICDRLHNLVSEDIVKSRLDASPQPTLFRTLTRKYMLGRDINETYDDDAYYPLVVRSMSALLTRTMDRLGVNATRPQILKVVYDFRRVLLEHYRNVTERRPNDPADAGLWSFAADQPYILYASQRTIFALLAYADFLAKMNEFEGQVDSDEVLETDIKNLLSRTLVENFFGSAIKQIVGMAKTQATAIAKLQTQAAEMAKLSTDGQASIAALPVPLPKADWAAKVIRSWLDQLAHDLNAPNFDSNLESRAQAFLNLRAWAKDGNGVPEKHHPQLDELRTGFKELMAKYGFVEGDEPKAIELLPHLLRDALSNSASVGEWMLSSAPWEALIKQAVSLQNLITNRPSNRKTQ